MPFKGKPTKYEEWLKISDTDAMSKMRYYFKSSIKYSGYKTRKVQMGLVVYSSYDKFYAEMPNPQHNIILLYPDYNSPVRGEIVLDVFIDSLKHTHELLTS